MAQRDVENLHNRLARLPPKRTGLNSRPGRSRISASENRAGRCRWSVGFLGDLPFPPRFHSGSAAYSTRFTLFDSQDLDVKVSPKYFHFAQSGAELCALKRHIGPSRIFPSRRPENHLWSEINDYALKMSRLLRHLGLAGRAYGWCLRVEEEEMRLLCRVTSAKRLALPRPHALATQHSCLAVLKDPINLRYNSEMLGFRADICLRTNTRQSTLEEHVLRESLRGYVSRSAGARLQFLQTPAGSRSATASDQSNNQSNSRERFSLLAVFQATNSRRPGEARSSGEKAKYLQPFPAICGTLSLSPPYIPLHTSSIYHVTPPSSPIHVHKACSALSSSQSTSNSVYRFSGGWCFVEGVLCCLATTPLPYKHVSTIRDFIGRCTFTTATYLLACLVSLKEISHSASELILLAQEFSEACQGYFRPMTEVEQTHSNWRFGLSLNNDTNFAVWSSAGMKGWGKREISKKISTDQRHYPERFPREKFWEHWKRVLSTACALLAGIPRQVGYQSLIGERRRVMLRASDVILLASAVGGCGISGGPTYRSLTCCQRVTWKFAGYGNIVTRRDVYFGAAVVYLSDYPPPTQAIRARIPAGSFHLRTWKSHQTVLLVGGFSRGSPVSLVLAFQRCPMPISLHPHQLSRPQILRAAQISSLTLSPLFSLHFLQRSVAETNSEGGILRIFVRSCVEGYSPVQLYTNMFCFSPELVRSSPMPPGSCNVNSRHWIKIPLHVVGRRQADADYLNYRPGKAKKVFTLRVGCAAEIAEVMVKNR
ncbi:hypothetical protein PR048_007541 [Dryococelus australis]|uniref:Uncharacterized protein n=1 Tax=Dryococelus australis TaxID=614101 RepID=A0ABQ9HVG2_9NEOP|nr:hypothetical protein PR048_007541 [Dryococelus australis]